VALSQKTHQRLGWWGGFLGGSIYWPIATALSFYFGETIIPWVFLGVFVLIAAAVFAGDRLMESGRLSRRSAISGMMGLMGVSILISLHVAMAFSHTDFGRQFDHSSRWLPWTASVPLLFFAVMFRWMMPANCSEPRRDEPVGGAPNVDGK